MAGFIYFKPGGYEPQITLAQLQKWGLAYAFEQLPVSREVRLDGVRGTAFAEESLLQGKAVGVYPDEQLWGDIPCSDCRVGFYREAKPTESDLARSERLPSYLLELDDGQRWWVPQVVDVVEGQPQSNLPNRLDVDAEGKIIPGTPVERWQYLWKLAEPYIDAFMVPRKGQVYDIDTNDVLGDAVKLLQVNYRLGLRELLLLELLPNSEQRILEIPLCAIDFATWLKWQTDLAKKKDSLAVPAGLDTAAGDADSPPSTDPLPQTLLH